MSDASPFEAGAIRAVAFDAYGTLFRFSDHEHRLLVAALLVEQGLEVELDAFAESLKKSFQQVSPWAVEGHRREDGSLDREYMLSGPVPGWISTWEIWRRQFAHAFAEYALAGDATAAANRQRCVLSESEAYPEAQLTVNMCTQWKEQYGFVRDSSDAIEVMIPVNGKPVAHNITKQLSAACSILIKPIVDGIHQLVASFNPEFQERLRSNVILSGGGGQLDGLTLKVQEGLDAIGGGHVTHVEEPMYAGAAGALQLAEDMPGDFWEQLQKPRSAA